MFTKVYFQNIQQFVKFVGSVSLWNSMMINVEKKGKNLGGGGVVVGGVWCWLDWEWEVWWRQILQKALSLSLRAMMNVFATFHKCWYHQSYHNSHGCSFPLLITDSYYRASPCRRWSTMSPRPSPSTTSARWVRGNIFGNSGIFNSSQTAAWL